MLWWLLLTQNVSSVPQNVEQIQISRIEALECNVLSRFQSFLCLDELSQQQQRISVELEGSDGYSVLEVELGEHAVYKVLQLRSQHSLHGKVIWLLGFVHLQILK